MKTRTLILTLTLIGIVGCTSQKKLSYLTNLPPSGAEQYFPMEIPDYKIQNRDVLYITLKAMNPEGMITDFLAGTGYSTGTIYMQGDGGYIYGYNVNKEGNIILPIMGTIHVEGKTLDETRVMLQEQFNKSFKNAVLECKLLSFKFTVIGEVKVPGTYINYNNYLTVFEAVGRAGGIDDYGKRDKVLVVRTDQKGTKTFTLNLQDKNILSSEAYFLLPNDIVIVAPEKHKIFNLNFPVFSAVLTTVTSLITTTVLLINYIGK